MKERERAVMTVMLITVLFASCVKAARLTHDADSPGLRAKVSELTHSDTLRFIQPAAAQNPKHFISLVLCVCFGNSWSMVNMISSAPCNRVPVRAAGIRREAPFKTETGAVVVFRSS